MIQIKFFLYITEPTISKEVNAMAEALNTIAKNDFIDSSYLINHFYFYYHLGLDL